MRPTILLVLLILPVAQAVVLQSENYKIDYTFKPSYITSQGAFVANPSATTSYKGYLFVPVSVAEEIRRGGGGGGGTTISTNRYELFIDVKGNTHRPSTKVTAKIYIINKADHNDFDVELRLYLFSPLNQTYDEHLTVIENLQPTCNIGEYNLSRMACIYQGRMYRSYETIVEHTLQLPDQSVHGEWYYIAELDTRYQPKVYVYDSFIVKQQQLWLLILVVLVLMVVRKRRLEQIAKRKLNDVDKSYRY